jgi:hypothetical protein
MLASTVKPYTRRWVNGNKRQPGRGFGNHQFGLLTLTQRHQPSLLSASDPPI